MHVETKIEARSVWYQLLVDVKFVQVRVKPAETAGENGELNVRFSILDVIISDEEILAVCVVVDACVCSVCLFCRVLVRNR